MNDYAELLARLDARGNTTPIPYLPPECTKAPDKDCAESAAAIRAQAKQIKILRMAIYHIIKDQGLNSDNAEIAHEALRAGKEEGK